MSFDPEHFKGEPPYELGELVTRFVSLSLLGLNTVHGVASLQADDMADLAINIGGSIAAILAYNVSVGSFTSEE